MRAINTTTLQLENIDPAGQSYAILSHTWGSEEVLFDDIRNLGPRELATSVSKKGASKVIGSCIQAKKDRYSYIWIDTCCIDKSSSAELSEAINSMFQWYALADKCYAYLGDVTTSVPVGNMGSLSGRTPEDPIQSSEFLAGRWFTRGWTLQELIAPPDLIFFDRDWVEFGTRTTFSARIASALSIAEPLLNREGYHVKGSRLLHQLLDTVPASTRMTWASRRVTTRPEDLAYSLMGLFDVNMPLLYGEGGTKAFVRLQREIITARSDQSILAWTTNSPSWTDRISRGSSILAPNPGVHFLPVVKDEPLLSPSGLGSLSLQGNSVQATVFLAKLCHHRSPGIESYAAVLQFEALASKSLLGVKSVYATQVDFLARPALHVERLYTANGDAVYRKMGDYMLMLLHKPWGGAGVVRVTAYDNDGSSYFSFEDGEYGFPDREALNLETITLLDRPVDYNLTFLDRSPLPLLAPPLSIQVKPSFGEDSSSRPFIRLHASTTEDAADNTAPSSLPLQAWKWLSPCQTVATLRTGVLCFIQESDNNPASKLECGFLVIWSVQLPEVAARPRWDTSYATSDRDLNMSTSWWNGGLPLLLVLPFSELNDDFRARLQALERGTSKGVFSGFLQQQFTTLDGLLGEARDYGCACWVTGDSQSHVDVPGTVPNQILPIPMTRDFCTVRLAAYAEAAVKFWIPRMVPSQELILDGVTVVASIRKHQLLDRTSFTLEIKTSMTASSCNDDVQSKRLPMRHVPQAFPTSQAPEAHSSSEEDSEHDGDDDDGDVVMEEPSSTARGGRGRETLPFDVCRDI